MTSSSPPSEGGAGAVLSPEAWKAERAEYEQAEITLRQELDEDEALSAVQWMVHLGWRPPGAVAALVSQARAEGAAEERERIARDLHEGGYGQAAVRLARQGWPSSSRGSS